MPKLADILELHIVALIPEADLAWWFSRDEEEEISIGLFDVSTSSTDGGGKQDKRRYSDEGEGQRVFPLPVYHTIGGYKWNNLK